MSTRHQAADAILTTALAGRPAGDAAGAVRLALAQADDDRAYVENWCRRIATARADHGLVATAAVGLGHLARRFGALEPESVDLIE